MNSLWQGPRAGSFITSIANKLVNERSHCVLFLPERYHEGFLTAFREHATNRGHFVHAAALKEESGLFDSLSDIFCNDETETLSFDNIGTRPARDGGIPVLLAPENNAPNFAECLKLAELLKDKARAARYSGERDPWHMLFVTTPGAPFPEQDIGFQHFHWWGKLTLADLQFAIEEALVHYNYSRPVRLWKYALCLGLCHSAMELTPIFAKYNIPSYDEVTRVLKSCEVANRENGTIVKKLLEKRAHPQSREELPDGAALDAWRAGIIEIGFDNDLEIHPSALWAAGREDIIREKLLAAQIKVYFPLVQEVCYLLRKKLSMNEKRLATDQEFLNIAEIGEFRIFFKKHRDMADLYSDDKETADIWWMLRNSLAHQTMINGEHALKAALRLDQLKESTRRE